MNKGIVAVIIFLVFSIFLFSSSDFFIIRNIEISSEKIGCANDGELKDAAGLFGKNFFILDIKNIEISLKKKFICIKDITLSRLLPNRIRLEVQGRDPAASLVSIKDFEASASSLIENTATPSATQRGDTFVVDDEGVVFLKSSFINDIPKIFVFGTLQDDYLKKSLKILRQLKSFGIDNKEISLINNLFIVSSIPKIVFRLDQDVDLQIASLQLILQRAKIDSKELEFIDLRFDKPVLKFAPKKNG